MTRWLLALLLYAVVLVVAMETARAWASQDRSCISLREFSDYYLTGAAQIPDSTWRRLEAQQ